MPAELSRNIRCEWEEARLRFRFAGVVTLILASLGWAIWFLPFDNLVDRAGKPLGGDFVMLYVAGQAFAEGSPLYDDALNQTRSSALFPAMDPNESWPYRYPPTVAMVMSLFSQLSFTLAFGIFCFIQAALLSTSLWLLVPLLNSDTQRSDDDKAAVTHRSWLMALIGCPVVLECFIGGQASLFALMCVSLFLVLHRKGFNFTAGCVLALALYKPNVLGLFIVGVLVAYPRHSLGFALTALFGLTTTCWIAGSESVQDYLYLTFQLSQGAWGLETPYWKVHGIAPVFQSLLPAYGKLITGLIGLFLSIFVAIRHRQGKMDWHATVAALLVANAIFNPYIPIYDLVLLIPATLAAVRYVKSSGVKFNPVAAQITLACLWLGPHISQAASVAIGIQIFPWVLLTVGIAVLTRGKPAGAERQFGQAIATQ